ncbi:MAG: ASCH domain-containing protein [Candidatus Nitrosopolaris sp.]
MISCISIRQPYAELILSRRKVIELRNWQIQQNSTLNIHVPNNVDYPACMQHGISYAIDNTCQTIQGSFRVSEIKEYDEISFEQDKHLHLSTKFYKIWTCAK